MHDPFYAWIERTYAWLWIPFVSWIIFFVVSFAAAIGLNGTISQAVQFGLSVLIWGIFVRTVIHWHFTWSVNSVTHRWGYRNYDTADHSRNNALIALISNGEGWHNNHHADPRSARHGHRWWEIDVAWLLIRLLMWLGLARDVALPQRPR
jgi:stearoyl-CoA desaturase (delta-9 desaturase)